MALSETVQAIGKIHLEGNIIPHAWYQADKLRFPASTPDERGKPNMVAIILLSDILYWYRPMVIRDEATGAILEVRQRFAADKLQKSYQAWADQFGFTKRQVQDAVLFLRDQGLITVERRTIEVGGTQIGNVVFLEPVVAAIQVISAPYNAATEPLQRSNVEGATSQRRRSNAVTSKVQRSGGVATTSQRRTNTKNTAEITTENTTKTTQREEPPLCPPPGEPPTVAVAVAFPPAIEPILADVPAQVDSALASYKEPGYKVWPRPEPTDNNPIKHLLWRIEISDQGVLPRQEAGRCARVAADLLRVANEEEIMRAYEWRKAKTPDRIYHFYNLAVDWTGILAAMQHSKHLAVGSRSLAETQAQMKDWIEEKRAERRRLREQQSDKQHYVVT